MLDSSVRKFATGKHAWAYCDRCGWRFRYNELRPQFQYGKRTTWRVCATCLDKDDRRRAPAASDPQALRYARPDTSLYASRRIPHWYPVDALTVPLTVG